MNIQVTLPALSWFKEEFDLDNEGNYIRFFARYGGNSTIQSGFSLGVNQESPNQIGVKFEADGITFFIEENDLWYFKGYDLEVTFSKEKDELEFIYHEQKQA